MSNSAAQFKTNDNSDQLLILPFMIRSSAGIIQCGINIHKVLEVIQISEMSALPQDYFPFIGIYDLRGTPIPIIPLENIFNRTDGNQFRLDKMRVLVVELQGKIIGLLVDSTGRISCFHNSEVQATPAALQGLKTAYFNGVLKHQNSYIYLLELESILDSYGISLDGEIKIKDEKQIFLNKRILIVEDSKLYQKKLEIIFSTWGCKIEFANNGKEALEILSKKSFHFDLIFTDIEMPIMNGIEMATKIKSSPESSHLPIIFNSSLSNEMLINEIKQKSLGGYIVKLDQDAIRQEILSTLNIRL